MQKFLLTLLAMCALVLCVNAEVVFVANASVSDTSVSADFIDGVLKGKAKSWPSGGRIKLAVLRNGAVHDEMLSTYAGMNAGQFSNHWNRLVFTGKAAEPKSFSSEADLAAYVAANDGALGYVSSAGAAGSAKVISVQ